MKRRTMNPPLGFPTSLGASKEDIEDFSWEEDCPRVLSPKDNHSGSGVVTMRTSGRIYYEEKYSWKAFSSEKSFHIPTPTFDEISDREYFTSAKKQRGVERYHTYPNYESSSYHHYYYYHKDLRIQKQADNISQDSAWVDPKSYAGPVEDSAGHWYTKSSGQKVYVDKNGQELTGQTAYRHYRKETGLGFQNSKKRAAPKKK